VGRMVVSEGLVSFPSAEFCRDAIARLHSFEIKGQALVCRLSNGEVPGDRKRTAQGGHHAPPHEPPAARSISVLCLGWTRFGIAAVLLLRLLLRPRRRVRWASISSWPISPWPS
jgi:hypothetical protein